MTSPARPTTPSTGYQPLARRYRPNRFTGPTGLVGQPHVVRTLVNAITHGTLAPVYLFTGVQGTGKTTSARVLAAALNCPDRGADAEPCGTCDSCRRILDGRDAPDVLELDAASNRGIEDMRTLRDHAQYAPSTAHGAKVYILDEAHQITRDAWGVALKLLEQAPARTVFCLCTTEPQKIEQLAAPILSRCQRLDLRRVTVPELSGALLAIAAQEGIPLDEEAAAVLARRADGSVRDALSLLDQLRAFHAGQDRLTADRVREAFGLQSETLLLSIVDVLVTGDRARIFKLVDYLEAQAAEAGQILEDLQDIFGALALAQAGGIPTGWSGKGLAQLMKRAGLAWVDDAWAVTGPAVVGASACIDAMGAIQDALLTIRQAPRAMTVVLVVLQRLATRLAAPAAPSTATPAAVAEPAATAPSA